MKQTTTNRRTVGPFKKFMVTKIVLCIYPLFQLDSDGLVQHCWISIANSLEIPQSCTKPSIYCPDKAPAEVLLLWKRNSYGINITLFYGADANFQIIQTQPWNGHVEPVDIHNIKSYKERAEFQYVPRIMYIRTVLCLVCFGTSRLRRLTSQTAMLVGTTLARRRDDSTDVGPTLGQPTLLSGFSVTWALVGQSYDCPNVSKSALKDLGEYIIWLVEEIMIQRQQNCLYVYVMYWRHFLLCYWYNFITLCS